MDAEAAMTANGANVTAVNKGAFNHGGCVVPSLQGALNYFLSLKTDCTIGVDEIAFSKNLELYPNPATGWFTLDGFEGALT